MPPSPCCAPARNGLAVFYQPRHFVAEVAAVVAMKKPDEAQARTWATCSKSSFGSSRTPRSIGPFRPGYPPGSPSVRHALPSRGAALTKGGAC